MDNYNKTYDFYSISGVARNIYYLLDSYRLMTTPTQSSLLPLFV